ncbi:hypothetical protein Scep_028126 [Stephania cephalantha]|uniref:Uncharacterized protein n=1 Tax=Stephania cephalantha TaxID=152367 RepID=A0AAP0E9B7_9MAGN
MVLEHLSSMAPKVDVRLETFEAELKKLHEMEESVNGFANKMEEFRSEVCFEISAVRSEIWSLRQKIEAFVVQSRALRPTIGGDSAIGMLGSQIGDNQGSRVPDPLDPGFSVEFLSVGAPDQHRHSYAQDSIEDLLQPLATAPSHSKVMQINMFSGVNVRNLPDLVSASSVLPLFVVISQSQTRGATPSLIEAQIHKKLMIINPSDSITFNLEPLQAHGSWGLLVVTKEVTRIATRSKAVSPPPWPPPSSSSSTTFGVIILGVVQDSITEVDLGKTMLLCQWRTQGDRTVRAVTLRWGLSDNMSTSTFNSHYFVVTLDGSRWVHHLSQFVLWVHFATWSFLSHLFSSAFGLSIHFYWLEDQSSTSFPSCYSI